jgi:cytoskeletal protein CcmA (bactofilin family)
MKISGSGTLTEGKINDELHVSGSARIKGNFECNGFHSSGSLRGVGDLTVHGDIKSSGSFRLTGNLYGDGDFRSSGSTAVDGEVLIKGKLHSSGSLRGGKKVEAIDGIRVSGSARIEGDVLTLELIEISGSSIINGNITATDVILGRERTFSRSIFKHPNKVYGNILARNNIELNRALVEGDVKGRDVTISRGTEISGTVYYVDTIEVHDKATLTNEPVQISEEGLHL